VKPSRSRYSLRQRSACRQMKQVKHTKDESVTCAKFAVEDE
jgi:hypothetical protein